MTDLGDVIRLINEMCWQKNNFSKGLIPLAFEKLLTTEKLKINNDVKCEIKDKKGFISLVQSDLYVDKSLFLQKVLKMGVVYISRPNGWGKTMLF